MTIVKTYTLNIVITLRDEDADIAEKLDRKFAEGTMLTKATTMVCNISVDGYAGIARGVLARMGQTYGKGYNADHINNDVGDNRPENLQVLTSRENQQKRRNSQEKQSKYLGVSWSKKRNKWRSRVSYDQNGKKIARSAGYFDTEEAAAIAYDQLVLKLELNKTLNFLEETT